MHTLKYRLSPALIMLIPLASYAGDRVTKEIPVGYFDRVTVTDNTRLTIVQAETPSLKVTAAADQIDRVKAEQSGDRLYLGLDFKKSGWFGWLSRWNEDEVLFEVAMPALKELKAGGAVEVRIGDFQADDVRLEAAGASKVTVSRLDVQNCRAEFSGASDIEIAELRAENVYVGLSGASNGRVAVLEADTLDVSLSGASDYEITGTGRAGSVMVNASGASSYHGKKLLSQKATVKTNGASHADVNSREIL